MVRVRIDDLPAAEGLTPEQEELIQGAGLRSFRPRLEVLEGREVPATISVTSLADFALGARHSGVTLRDAVHAANTNTSVNGSVAGSGADEIIFSPNLAGTITLKHGELLINDAKGTTITGLGANKLTIDGTEPSRCAFAWPASPRPQRSVPIAFHQRKRAGSKRPPAPS